MSSFLKPPVGCCLESSSSLIRMFLSVTNILRLRTLEQVLVFGIRHYRGHKVLRLQLKLRQLSVQHSVPLDKLYRPQGDLEEGFRFLAVNVDWKELFPLLQVLQVTRVQLLQRHSGSSLVLRQPSGWRRSNCQSVAHCTCPLRIRVKHSYPNGLWFLVWKGNERLNSVSQWR